ncbi:HAD family hydrolase [Rasiella sp. SM2506]|uniref:HAD family hydrolase n=1 Tax=Rasiella sp. SM2506 TaxID=3423914 RepID=UPI003D7B82F8
MKTLYLYDFDGTITNKDSLFEFLKFATPSLHYNFILLKFAPLFLVAKLGLLDKGTTKRSFISACLKGKTREEISKISKAFLGHIQQGDFFKQNALATIKKHNQKGDVYIVSASLDLWLDAIAQQLGVGLICTQSEFKNDVFSGNFKTPNCNYEEKPKRVKAEIDLSKYAEIMYYGDSKGDMAMKPLATKFHYNNF